MARFFVDRLPEAGSLYELTGENAAHAKVLRLRPGEAVTLCDGRGADCPCTVTEGLTLLAGPALPCPAEPRVRVTVWLAFPKADKAEHVIQKAVELGAAELVLFPSRWCVSRPEGKALEKKLERWQKIARSAAEQSRRGVIPAVRAADSFSEALKEAAAAELPILFYENAAGYSLHDALADLGASCTVEAPPHPSPAATPSPQGEGFAHDALAELGASRIGEVPPHPSPAATPSPQGEGFAHDALADLGALRTGEAPPHPLPAAVQAARISLMTGSEGGFSEEEIGKAEAAGMKICTLGPRILRCETAPLAALTAVMYALGEM